MDDLREKLAKLGMIAVTGEADNNVLLVFNTAEDAQAAHDAVMFVKDAHMGIIPADSAWQAEDAQAAFIKGAGDNAHLLQGGDAIDPVDAPLKVQTGFDRFEERAAGMQPSFVVGGAPCGPMVPIDTLDAQTWVDAMLLDPSLDHDQAKAEKTMVAWFDAAIKAGYSAARPLDPGRIYVGTEQASVNSNHFEERAGDAETDAADAAGEGMGVAGECR